MLIYERDTIAAVATATGQSAIGIVRLSGPEAVAIGSRCFRGKERIEDFEDRRLTLGTFVAGGQDLDQVLVSVMRAPKTYTGEDVVEFNCHGGALVLRRALACLVDAGARLAGRGEFTKRAFLNGRLDLTQAEAVADIIRASAGEGLRSAFFQLRGGLAKRFEQTAEVLRGALARLEADLDFLEDAEGDRAGLDRCVGIALDEIRGLAASYRQGKIIREGAVVTLAGKPNVGKSSLLNRLLEEERAIVTPVPGTTLDTIEESIDMDGIRVTLVDTAGIRETKDPVERAGTERSELAVDRADLVLLLVDGSSVPDGQDTDLLDRTFGRDAVLVLNKADLGVSESWDRYRGQWECVEISALYGNGMDDLRCGIRAFLVGAGPLDHESVTHQRQVDALRLAEIALVRCDASLEAGLPGEIAAMEIREALQALGGIVGETTTENVLDRIFETFCIGK